MNVAMLAGDMGARLFEETEIKPKSAAAAFIQSHLGFLQQQPA